MDCEIIGRAITPEDRKKSKAEAAKERAAIARRRRYAAHRDEINARRRAKYAADTEYRASEQARKRANSAKFADRRRAYSRKYRLEHREQERDRDRKRRLKRREARMETERRSEQKKKERMANDPAYRNAVLKRKRERMRQWRAERSGKPSPSSKPGSSHTNRPVSMIPVWEKVAAGGPKKVAAYMNSVQDPIKTQFLHWYGKKMNWIDSTGSRRFQPPPDAEFYEPSDDFFFS